MPRSPAVQPRPFDDAWEVCEAPDEDEDQSPGSSRPVSASSVARSLMLSEGSSSSSDGPRTAAQLPARARARNASDLASNASFDPELALARARQVHQSQQLFPFALDVGDGRLLGLLCDPNSQRCQPASALLLGAWAERAISQLPLILSPENHARAAAYVMNISLSHEAMSPAQLPRRWRKLLQLPGSSWSGGSDDAVLALGLTLRDADATAVAVAARAGTSSGRLLPPPDEMRLRCDDAAGACVPAATDRVIPYRAPLPPMLGLALPPGAREIEGSPLGPATRALPLPAPQSHALASPFTPPLLAAPLPPPPPLLSAPAPFTHSLALALGGGALLLIGCLAVRTYLSTSLISIYSPIYSSIYLSISIYPSLLIHLFLYIFLCINL